MLPKPLTEDICSLRAEVERLAFSVLWEITEDARIIGVRFTKSVIRCAPQPREGEQPVLCKSAALLCDFEPQAFQPCLTHAA